MVYKFGRSLATLNRYTSGDVTIIDRKNEHSMKIHSLFALSIILLLLLGNLGSVPYNGDPQTEPTQVNYLPVVFQDYSPLPPPFSTSYYVQLSVRDSHSNRLSEMRNLGCRIGQLETATPGAQDHIVILALGQPWTSGPNFKISFFRPPGVSDWYEPNLEDVDALIKEAILGYWACKDENSRITIALGVNTYGNFGIPIGGPKAYADEAHGHGYYFARMIERLSGWLKDERMDHRIVLAGALDSELNFNPPEIARNWVDGFIAAKIGKMLYNFGTCEGCPESPKTGWSGANGWTQDDVWYVSWGAGPVMPLPEIYAVNGVHARQWKYMNWYAANVKKMKMVFAGSLTQYQACQQVGGCGSGKLAINNYPSEGWWQLYNELNSDPTTAQSYLPWSSDMRWMGY